MQSALFQLAKNWWSGTKTIPLAQGDTYRQKTGCMIEKSNSKSLGTMASIYMYSCMIECLCTFCYSKLMLLDVARLGQLQLNVIYRLIKNSLSKTLLLRLHCSSFTLKRSFPPPPPLHFSSFVNANPSDGCQFD